MRQLQLRPHHIARGWFHRLAFPPRALPDALYWLQRVGPPIQGSPAAGTQRVKRNLPGLASHLAPVLKGGTG